MNRSTGIVIGVSALAGLAAAWTTLATFDPDKTGAKQAREHGSAPVQSSREMSRIWQTGNMGDVMRRSGLWSVDDPDAVWPKYYRACALDRLGQDSAHAWQLVLDTIDHNAEDPEQSTDGNREFWNSYLRGVALVRLGRPDEGRPELKSALELPGRLNPVSRLYIRANVEALLENPDGAIDLLEQSAQESPDNQPYWLSWAVHDPEFANITDHPRFVALIQRLEEPQGPD
ncbi:hypothetical protein DRQ53_15360 [bacterium]|nr:MAG: hypothetical protein DRQ53_15360 [bacterium]